MTRGETLDQASLFTRIKLPYLRALEHDDASAFEPFPGMTYARYFLRDYAEHLGIDPGPLVRRFDREVSTPIIVRVGPTERPQRAPRPGRWAVGALVLLIVASVANGLWSARRDDASPTGRVQPAATTSSRAPNLGAEPPSRSDRQAPPAPVATIRAILRTTDRPSWVRVEVNGQVVQETTVPAGETLRFEATRMFGVRLGDAGAVVLVINGERVPTGGAGAVADLAFTIRSGRVVQR